MSSTTSGKPLAVVTGGSSGIGLELAKQFAKNGYDLLIAAEPNGLEQAAQDLRETGADVQTVAVDLATDDGVDTLYSQITADGLAGEQHRKLAEPGGAR